MKRFRPLDEKAWGLAACCALVGALLAAGAALTWSQPGGPPKTEGIELGHVPSKVQPGETPIP